MPRKHLISSGINKKQQKQAKIWMKCAREIKMAVKSGDTNPESNLRLRAAIDNALNNNLSKESIQKNIYGSNKDDQLLEEFEYEIFGPNGLGIIVKALTDNKNRTISSISGFLNKLGGQIAKQNSVKIFFDYQGQIFLDNEKISEEKLFDLISDYDVKDIITNEDSYEIIVSTTHYYELKNYLNNCDQVKIIDSNLGYIPNSYVNLSADEFAKLERFINSCEDEDDILWVVTNFGEVNENK